MSHHVRVTNCRSIQLHNNLVWNLMLIRKTNKRRRLQRLLCLSPKICAVLSEAASNKEKFLLLGGDDKVAFLNNMLVKKRLRNGSKAFYHTPHRRSLHTNHFYHCCHKLISHRLLKVHNRTSMQISDILWNERCTCKWFYNCRCCKKYTRGTRLYGLVNLHTITWLTTGWGSPSLGKYRQREKKQ